MKFETQDFPFGARACYALDDYTGPYHGVETH